MKNTTKQILTLATAGFFAFSATTAFANEGNEDLGLEVVSESEVDLNSENIIVDIPSLEEIGDDRNQELETPSVLPGDFFYFVKTALEKIRLAFTFDDAKEAKLLATYAMERLAEAEALFENGDEEEALETINDALVYLEDAGESSTEEEIVEDPTSVEENENKEEEPKVEEDTQKEETTDHADVETDEESFNEVEQLISQNIVALTAAMEKVKNPVAKAALKRNIEKSYAKLTKKLEKIERKYVELEPIVDPNTFLPDEDNNGELGLEVVESTDKEEIEEDNAVENSVEEQVVVKGTTQKQAESTKNEVKAVKKQLKEEQKIIKKIEKQQKKDEKKAAKIEAKIEKNNEKESFKGKGNKENKNHNNKNNNGHSSNKGNNQ